jgi:hypothetical protein
MRLLGHDGPYDASADFPMSANFIPQISLYNSDVFETLVDWDAY